MVDATQKQREVLFNNLLILGLDKASIEKKHRVIIDKDMFCVPNQKAFEVVSYFLFTKLNQVSSAKYSLPWPVLDKDQHRQFQKSCFSHLTTIASESDIKFPRFVFSLISTFCGDRFYELYLAFSNHVIQRTIMKRNNISLVKMPSLTPHNIQDACEVLKIATILSVEKFQEVQSFSLDHFNFVLKCSKKFFADIQSFKKSIASNSSLLEKNMNILTNIYCEGQTEKKSFTDIVTKSSIYEEKVKELWTSLEKFLLQEGELWHCISPQIEENNETLGIDGANFRFDLIDDLIKSCPVLVEDGLNNEEKENVDLLKYLKIFHDVLEYYIKTTVKRDFLQTSDLCLIKNASVLKENLKYIRNLNQNLVENVLPSMKDNTRKLEENSYFQEEFSKDLEDFLKQCPSFRCCTTNVHQHVNSSRREQLSNGEHTGGAFNLNTPCVYTKFVEDELLKLHSGEVSRNIIEDDQDILLKSNIFPLLDLESGLSGYILQNTHQADVVLEDRLDNKFPLQILDLESNLEIDTLALNYTKLEANIETSTQNLISSPAGIHLEDTVFIPSSLITDFEIKRDAEQPFKLRESWQLEESLNAITLPDVPELEESLG